MSYMGRFFMEVLTYLEDRKDNLPKVGDVIEVETDTFEGRKKVNHEITQSDLVSFEQYMKK